MSDTSQSIAQEQRPNVSPQISSVTKTKSKSIPIWVWIIIGLIVIAVISSGIYEFEQQQNSTIPANYNNLMIGLLALSNSSNVLRLNYTINEYYETPLNKYDTIGIQYERYHNARRVVLSEAKEKVTDTLIFNGTNYTLCIENSTISKCFSKNSLTINNSTISQTVIDYGQIALTDASYLNFIYTKYSNSSFDGHSCTFSTGVYEIAVKNSGNVYMTACFSNTTRTIYNFTFIYGPKNAQIYIYGNLTSSGTPISYSQVTSIPNYTMITNTTTGYNDTWAYLLYLMMENPNPIYPEAPIQNGYG